MVKRVGKTGAKLAGTYCPYCGIMIFMQPGIKQCGSCKAIIGMDVWIESPPPPVDEETK